jgi:hypothetical protein
MNAERPKSQLTSTHSVLLKRTFGLKPDSQFAESYESIVSFILNMEDLILDFFLN